MNNFVEMTCIINPDRKLLSIEREALTVESMRHRFDIEASKKKKKDMNEHLKDSLKYDKKKAKTFLIQKIPILNWLFRYDKSWLMGDIISGLTMSVIHIPQGLGFAMLANIPAISGLYMAFFPCIIYALFASSRHNSMGTFAIITMMTGTVVNKYATFPIDNNGIGMVNASLGISISEIVDTFDHGKDVVAYTPIQIATVVTFMVGIWQMIFGFLQLGRLCVFLSDTVISAFTTAAALYVILSQLKFALGVSVPLYSGLFKFIYFFIALCKQIPSANIATVIIAVVTMVALVLHNEVLKPRIAKISKIPFPMETIIIVIATFASHFFDFSGNFGVKIVNHIPIGLPPATLPPMAMLGRVVGPSFTIAIVAYIINFSIAKIFANKHDYNVDSNQELYAQGLANLFGSFFSCAPIAVALVRPVLIDHCGGKTQLVSLIAAAIMIPVLLWLGPLLESLPNAVFGVIIIVTLKGMVMQIEQLSSAWKLSKADGMTWFFTFVSTLALDIEYGLMVGIICSLLVLLDRNQSSSGIRLGRVKSLNIFLDIDKYSEAKEIPGFMLYQIFGSLHFANRSSLQANLIKHTGLDPVVLAKVVKQNKVNNQKVVTLNEDDGVPIFSVNITDQEFQSEKPQGNNANKPSFSVDINAQDVKYLILDMSCVSHVDIAAGNHLAKLYENYERAGIKFCLAGMTESVFTSLEVSSLLSCYPTDHLFHSLLDAVAILTENKEVESKVIQ